jgi:plasmid stability protein
MEAELRAILNTALESGPDRDVNLAEAIRRRFAPVGGVDLADHPRELVADPIDFMS